MIHVTEINTTQEVGYVVLMHFYLLNYSMKSLSTHCMVSTCTRLYYLYIRTVSVNICFHCDSLHHDHVHYFFHRVRTVLQRVLLVYMDQAACPPALAIIMLLALPSMAPVSAGKVQWWDIQFTCNQITELPSTFSSKQIS